MTSCFSDAAGISQIFTKMADKMADNDASNNAATVSKEPAPPPYSGPEEPQLKPPPYSGPGGPPLQQGLP